MQHQLDPKNSLGELCRFAGSNNDKHLAAMLACHRPFVIKDFSTKWATKWDLDYLENKAGDCKVWVRDSYLHSHSSKIESIKFAQFISNIRNRVNNNAVHSPNLYLVLSRIFAHHRARAVQLASLLEDIDIPSLIPIERLWEINLWIGEGNNKSHLHFDPEENILAPIKEPKTVIIMHRKDTKNVYQNLGGNILQSKIDIFDLDRKNFYKIDNVKYYQSTIEPGEALYIPSGWWHAVESSKKVNIAVNFWWLPRISFLFKFPTCRRLWEKRSKWFSVMLP